MISNNQFKENHVLNLRLGENAICEHLQRLHQTNEFPLDKYEIYPNYKGTNYYLYEISMNKNGRIICHVTDEFSNESKSFYLVNENISDNYFLISEILKTIEKIK